MTRSEHPTDVLAVPAPRAAGCPFDPPPAYEAARREGPVSPIRLWDGASAWMVTGHEEIRQVLQDRRFSADGSHPGFPSVSAGRKALAKANASFLRMDDPEHARLRRMLTADFMVKRIDALRPRIRAVAEQILDGMVRGRDHGDLVADFALPLPSLVICLLLGVPYEDHEYFQGASHAMLDNALDPGEARVVRGELLEYIRGLVRTKRHDGADDILGRLARQHGLSDDEVAATGLLLLVAGHETTANMTALSMLALLRDPAQMERLRAEPALIPGAVEELLRYLTIVHTGLTRVALEDVEVGGVAIGAGEGVLCMVHVANRDGHVFPGGDGLDLDRDARRHLAFGFGVHQCLGQPLARAELQIALDLLLSRLPGLRLAVPFEDVSFRHDMLVYGVDALPVAW